METAMACVWLGGWLAATLWTATWGFGEDAPPPFIVVLAFGWMWPAFLALVVIIAPLYFIAERANRRIAPPRRPRPMCLIHKWPKQWSNYGATEGGWPIQYRTCERCKKLQLVTRYPK